MRIECYGLPIGITAYWFREVDLADRVAGYLDLTYALTTGIPHSFLLSFSIDICSPPNIFYRDDYSLAVYKDQIYKDVTDKVLAWKWKRYGLAYIHDMVSLSLASDFKTLRLF